MSIMAMLRPSARELNKHGLLVISRVDAYRNSVPDSYFSRSGGIKPMPERPRVIPLRCRKRINNFLSRIRDVPINSLNSALHLRPALGTRQRPISLYLVGPSPDGDGEFVNKPRKPLLPRQKRGTSQSKPSGPFPSLAHLAQFPAIWLAVETRL